MLSLIKEERKETQILVKKAVSMFFKRDIRPCVCIGKELFSSNPVLFYELLYNMRTMNSKEYDGLLEKALSIEHIKLTHIVNFFRELNVLLTSDDIDIINKSKLFNKLTKFVNQSSGEEREILNLMQDIGRPLYIELLVNIDQLGFFQLLSEKGLIKNKETLILEYKKMKNLND